MLSPRAITGNVTAATVVLPYDQQPYAQPLSPQLPAFSIEMDRWPDWSGPAIGQPNPFVNTISSRCRTGRVPRPTFVLAVSLLASMRPCPGIDRFLANSEDKGLLDLQSRL